ncbi:MAG: GNAT family N-acetyltransferase [Spirochaetales bacterium]|nr:GNAT family N-acetyltransferase [Spirochaetales bacterium]
MVHPNYQNKGIGTKLMNETFMQRIITKSKGNNSPGTT